MTEKLRIDGSFGDCSAVHCNIFPMLAHTVGMHNLGKELLTHTTLAGNEHRQIGMSHLYCSIDGPEQSRIVAYYPKLLFYFLYID